MASQFAVFLFKWVYNAFCSFLMWALVGIGVYYFGSDESSRFGAGIVDGSLQFVTVLVTTFVLIAMQYGVVYVSRTRPEWSWVIIACLLIITTVLYLLAGIPIALFITIAMLLSSLPVIALRTALSTGSKKKGKPKAQ